MLGELLRSRLKGAKRIIVLGVGNELRGDDAAGFELARRMKKKVRSSRRVRVIEGGASPENFTSVIRAFKPSHILLIDAAQMGLPPGSVRILEKNDLSGFTFSTHNLSLSLLIDYLQKDLNVETVVMGVEPLKAEMGEPISKPVMDSVISLDRVLIKVLRSMPQLDVGRRG